MIEEGVRAKCFRCGKVATPWNYCWPGKEWLSAHPNDEGAGSHVAEVPSPAAAPPGSRRPLRRSSHD
jgi:hypothetical protein